MGAAARARRRVVVIVADGFGVGGLGPDNTFASVCATGRKYPHLERLGLADLAGVGQVPAHSSGMWGRLSPLSVGTDTVTGHWEMAGVVDRDGFATFTRGLPKDLVSAVAGESGVTIVNAGVASGTDVVAEYGPRCQRERLLVAYTSADSVFQLAAHCDTVAVEDLYRVCTIAARHASTYRIARVIARPFVGGPGSYTRTYDRKDFVAGHDAPTMLDVCAAASVDTVGVGKIGDIFGGRGLRSTVHTSGNTDGLNATVSALADMDSGLLFVNLVDFDTLYGHRRDVAGYGEALAELDRWLEQLPGVLRDDDVVIVTSDHGNDPGAPGFNHTRECVPFLLFGPGVRRRGPLGQIAGFDTVAATVVDLLDVDGAQLSLPARDGRVSVAGQVLGQAHT